MHGNPRLLVASRADSAPARRQNERDAVTRRLIHQRSTLMEIMIAASRPAPRSESIG